MFDQEKSYVTYNLLDLWTDLFFFWCFSLFSFWLLILLLPPGPCPGGGRRRGGSGHGGAVGEGRTAGGSGWQRVAVSVVFE